MPLEEFEAILKFFPELLGVVLCGMYEPLLDVRLNAILDIIEKCQPKAEITIFTNGSLLTQPTAQMLLSHPNFKNLVVSIHGFSKEVYESVMVGLNRDKVYENVQNFMRLVGCNPKPKPKVSVTFVRIKQNIAELEAFRKFWKDKVDVVRDFEVCSWQGQVPVEELYYELPKGRRQCPMFTNPLVIDAYGNVVLCCYCFTQNYGHVLKGGFEKWLNKTRVSETFPLYECEKCNGWTYP
jgi:sulfatase maturation enzyme AslB (radical SAM superfamily)